MYRTKPYIFKKSISLLLIFTLLSTMVLAFPHTHALNEAYSDPMELGSVSASYESNGDPGTISSGSGDSGGKSYGAYQFASKYSVPHTFANWLISSTDDGSTIGQQLLNAYAADGNTFGANFDLTWKNIATAQPYVFLELQHRYIKVQYYDKVADWLKEDFGFDLSLHGMALKNAIWSRAVQHGAVGCYNLFHAITQEYGSMNNYDDLTIIRVLYFESAATRDAPDADHAISASKTNSTYYKEMIATYALEGKQLKYYSSNSINVQLSVFNRIRINELNDLTNMFYNEFPFYDVRYSDWYYPYVYFVADRGIMTGMETHAFCPEETTTRAMLVTVLYRMANKPGISGTNSFVDCEYGSWYYDAVTWAVANGITNGTSETNHTFSPNDLVTREQVIAFLYRYAQMLGLDTSASDPLTSYPDQVTISDYARIPVQWSVGCGIINGSNGVLLPQGIATRAQIAKMIKCFIEIYSLNS